MTQSRPARQGHRARREPRRKSTRTPGPYDMGTLDEVDVLRVARQQGVTKLPSPRLEKGHLGDWFLYYEFPRVKFRVGPLPDLYLNKPESKARDLADWLHHDFDQTARFLDCRCTRCAGTLSKRNLTREVWGL